MPVLATEAVASAATDLNEEQTSVQLKDVKDGKEKECFIY